MTNLQSIYKIDSQLTTAMLRWDRKVPPSPWLWIGSYWRSRKYSISVSS
jgi:hypothetical protein